MDGGLVNPVPVTLCRAMGADLVIAVNLNSEIIGKHLRNSRTLSHEFVAEEDSPTGRNGNHDSQEMRKAEGDFLRRLSQIFGESDESADEAEAQPMPGVMDVIATSINIMQDRVTRSRMAGDPADLVLSPRLSHLGLMEFYRANEAIAGGEQTVEYALPALKTLLGLDEA